MIVSCLSRRGLTSFLRYGAHAVGTAVVCFFTLFAGQLLYGQATGSFSGIVADASGAAIPGAKVTVTAPATGFTRSATANDAGEYLIALLPVATYKVQVEQKGFQNAVAEDVRLQVDEHRELDFKLSPATVQTAVEVSATPVAVQTADATLGQVITSQQVADLPLNGRDFVQLATLTPGVTQETNPNSFFNGGPSSEASARGSFSLSVGGSRANSTDWLLDGNDNNELTSGAIAILSSIDSIQEFKVLTYNYSAEWGTRGGPTVLVTTKSGSDKFHGSALRIPPQHRPRCAQLLRRLHRKIQSQPVRRLDRRTDQERQTVLLCRLRREVSAPRHSVHGRRAHRGHAKRRLQPRCIRPSRAVSS